MRIIFQVFIIFIILLSCKNTKKTKVSKITIENNLSPELVKTITRGEDVYNNFCISCHMANGKGFSTTFPPLADSDYLMNKRIESIRAIKFGLSEEIIVNGKTYTTPMARLGLSNKEVADVMNYITNS